MANYQLVYDFDGRWPNLWFALIPLLFVAIGIRTYISNKHRVINSYSTKFDIAKRNYQRRFSIFFTIGAGLLFIVFTSNTLGEYFKTKRVYVKKLYRTIEGPVDNFHPMPWAGHDSETFDVNGIAFSFSDFEVGDYGYNNTASHGGTIKPGLKVRIGYFNNGYKNVILKLETTNNKF